MSIVWYPKIWWNFCLSEIRNKTNFYCGVVKVRVGSIQLLKHLRPEYCLIFLVKMFKMFKTISIKNKQYKKLYIQFKIFINFGHKMFQCPQKAKCFNNPRSKFVPRGKMFQYPHIASCKNLIQRFYQLTFVKARNEMISPKQ